MPLVTVCSLDRLLRDVVAGGLLLDIPRAIGVTYDLTVGGDAIGCVVQDSSGVTDRFEVPLAHGCLPCTLAASVGGTVPRVAGTPGTAAAVLALPPTISPSVVQRGLSRRSHGVVTAGVAAAFDGAALEWDLLGNDLLVERQLVRDDADRRSVGEALAEQLEQAHVLLSPEPLDHRADALLDHLVDRRTQRALTSTSHADLLLSRTTSPSDGRAGVLAVAETGASPRAGVWTISLRSMRPLHPGRLIDRLEDLGGGRLRGRGHFWLPTRPRSVVAWNGVGGQVSIGAVGHWVGPPRTALVVTGVDGDAEPLRRCFNELLLTDAELARGSAYWAEQADDFDPWLGAGREVA